MKFKWVFIIPMWIVSGFAIALALFHKDWVFLAVITGLFICNTLYMILTEED